MTSDFHLNQDNSHLQTTAIDFTFLMYSLLMYYNLGICLLLLQKLIKKYWFMKEKKSSMSLLS